MKDHKWHLARVAPSNKYVEDSLSGFELFLAASENCNVLLRTSMQEQWCI